MYFMKLYIKKLQNLLINSSQTFYIGYIIAFRVKYAI